MYNCEDRPEPWFEIDANELLNISNLTDTNTPIKIHCIRCEKCDKCMMIDMKHTDLEKYVRIKLGQTIFPTPEEKPCIGNDEDKKLHDGRCGKCENCKYIQKWII